MSGYQVVVIGEPHKDAWFGYQSEMLKYRAKLKEEGYESIGYCSFYGHHILTMIEPE